MHSVADLLVVVDDSRIQYNMNLYSRVHHNRYDIRGLFSSLIQHQIDMSHDYLRVYITYVLFKMATFKMAVMSVL